jgi:hypothetical protein
MLLLASPTTASSLAVTISLSLSWLHHCDIAELQEHKFLFTCVLLNCWHAFLPAQVQGPEDLDYKTFREGLADELFLDACVL